MDPIKKTFAEAFNDFELPVREELWERVLAKKQPKKKQPFPFLRVAAAIALLLVSGTIYWQILRNSTTRGDAEVAQSPEMNVTKPPVFKEEFLQPTKPESIDQPETSINDGRVISLPKSPKIHSKPITPSTAPSEIVANPVPDTQTPSDMTIHAEELVSTVPEEMPALENPALDPVTATHPLDVIAEVTIPATLSKRNSEQFIAKVKPALSDRSKTGPQRFLAALESLKPKVVDDLIAFGSRNTEIEINW